MDEEADEPRTMHGAGLRRRRGHAIPAGDPFTLSDANRQVVLSVLKAFAHMTGPQLSDITRRGEPWAVARGGVADDAKCTTHLGDNAIRDYFTAQMR